MSINGMGRSELYELSFCQLSPTMPHTILELLQAAAGSFHLRGVAERSSFFFLN